MSLTQTISPATELQWPRLRPDVARLDMRTTSSPRNTVIPVRTTENRSLLSTASETCQLFLEPSGWERALELASREIHRRGSVRRWRRVVWRTQGMRLAIHASDRHVTLLLLDNLVLSDVEYGDGCRIELPPQSVVQSDREELTQEERETLCDLIERIHIEGDRVTSTDCAAFAWVLEVLRTAVERRRIMAGSNDATTKSSALPERDVQASEQLSVFKIAQLAQLGFPAAVQVLIDRYRQIDERLAVCDHDFDLQRKAPLFQSMPDSNNVRLFAHHDIVRSLVQQFNAKRESSSVFLDIISGLDTRIIRGADDIRAYLSLPLSMHIRSRMPAHRSEQYTWRDFVQLPLARGYRHVGEKGRRTRFQTAPLNVWETTILFFRVIEAHLHFEHNLTLAHYSLHYNAILVDTGRHGQSVVPPLRSTAKVESIPDTLAPVQRHHSADNSDAGMWHIVTLRALHHSGDSTKEQPQEISFVFVLHSSDPRSRLQRTTNEWGALHFVELGNMERELEWLEGEDRPLDEPLRAAPHYHLAIITPEALCEALSQTPPQLPTYRHVLREGLHVPLDPHAVNGLEQLPHNFHR